tara:strand:+ start:68 stop:286 length:219 start_codon:yes stop_codon:yes gene_type:complete
MIDLMLTYANKRELKRRIVDVLNSINEIDYAVRDQQNRDEQLASIYNATRVCNKLFEEVDNANIIRIMDCKC